MRIGVDAYTIAQRRYAALELLDFAAARGLAGVQFVEAGDIDPRLAPAELKAFRQEAERRRLYVEVGIPSPNPTRRARAERRPVTVAEHAAGLLPHLDAAAALGCRHVRAYVGDRHDRFRSDPPWPDQLAATRAVLARLGPPARERGLKFAIETHADLTADELLDLIDALGDDLIGVTLDTGNLVMRLDEPLAAAARLAPFVLATHVKDAVLAFTERGLCWQARPVGSGALPIADLLGLLLQANPQVHLSIELHPRTYDLPIFDPAWLGFFPRLRPEALAAVVALAWSCEQRFAAGTLPRPEAIEAIPWDHRDLDWLAQSVGYLRPIVGLMNRLEASRPNALTVTPGA